MGNAIKVVEEKKEITSPELVTHILSFVSAKTAGSPTDSTKKWVDIRPCDMTHHLWINHQQKVANSQIKRILRANGYCPYKPLKRLATGQSPHRHEQFEIIHEITNLFKSMSRNPLISIDTKKKEPLGQFTRNQAVWTQKEHIPKVFDHDYSYLACGKAIPHGIYDMKYNQGYLSIGNSHETADFIIDNLRWWWTTHGIHLYPDASQILILCDAGGANSYRHYRFKMLLLELATQIGIELCVVHYPPYCSKFNPIERCLFCHVHRTIQNTILTDLEQVAELMKNTRTKTGLTVVVRGVDKHYPTKQPSDPSLIDQNRIIQHPKLQKFSYIIKV